MDRHIIPQSHSLAQRASNNAIRSQRIAPGGSGNYAQPPPGKGPPQNLKAEYSLENRNHHHQQPKSLHHPPAQRSLDSDTVDMQETGLENRAPSPWSTAAIPPWSTATRPLSDIRELTESSLAELTARHRESSRRPALSRKGSFHRNDSVSRKGSVSRKNSLRESLRHSRQGSNKVADLSFHEQLPRSEQTDASSAYSLPLHDVPPRTSSRMGRRPERTQSGSRKQQPSLPAPPPRGLGYTIPNRGRSRSPIKDIEQDELSLARQPSRTFVRTAEPNTDALDFPKHLHPRITVELHAGASLFVGGGSVEGHIRIVVEDFERLRHRRQLAISRVSIDLLGVEEISSSKRHVFLNLATELLDSDNPPPHTMVESLKQISPLDPFWLLAAPSFSHIPFLISLPLDVGPPPFHSKAARIRYVLCATALIRDHGKQYLVRSSQEVTVLSVYDPEKALMSLPSPLTASDEYLRHKEYGVESIKVTAGLHRQVWVSGTSIFIDVSIVNKSKKNVKRIELQLERDILCYKYVAATTMEKSASQARLFDSNERAILSKSALKQNSCGWAGVPAHSSDTRTCDIELPRGHATVKCGKYFEVRYFLNVLVGISHSKTITVQLPIVLIHMNSLDVVPNSVAQVAAAIEEKRAKIHHQRSHSKRRVALQNAVQPPNETTDSPSRLSRHPSRTAHNVQGRAFSAPRKQSLDRMRQQTEDLHEIGRLLEASPRKYLYTHNTQHPTPNGSDMYKYHTPPSNRKGRVLSDDAGDEAVNFRARLRRMRSTETNRSTTSQHQHQHAAPRRNKSVQSKASTTNTTTMGKVGFRELEVARGGSALDVSPNSENKGRFEGLSAGSARRWNMRGPERWRGGPGGWFGERSREREREREERQRMLANWI